MRAAIALIALAMALTGTACRLPLLLPPATDTPPTPAADTPLPAAASPTPLPTLQPPTAAPTLTPSPSPSPTPFGCLAPADDYTRVSVNGMLLNQRTLDMLEHAQELYGGTHDLVLAITQGSYTTAESASFGTHDGGGAVDLSVRDLNNWFNILYDDLDAIIMALRHAGLAAWVREADELYPDSPIHIHAIAIGDAELSQAARDQLDGPAGYFRGYNGLPLDPPQPDPHGGPVVCPWMETLGYRDLRPAAANITPTP
ncbi:MAG: hypothetical protein Kow00124_01920 [Anaerolineae bacterium]